MFELGVKRETYVSYSMIVDFLDDIADSDLPEGCDELYWEMITGLMYVLIDQKEFTYFG